MSELPCLERHLWVIWARHCCLCVCVCAYMRACVCEQHPPNSASGWLTMKYYSTLANHHHLCGCPAPSPPSSVAERAWSDHSDENSFSEFSYSNAPRSIVSNGNGVVTMETVMIWLLVAG